MTSGTSSPQPRSTEVADDWQTIADELLLGLVHALNNRVAALSAFVELAKLGDEEEDPLTVLPDEIAQLHRVNALFALLPARRSEAEALEISAVLDDAIRLHEQHPRHRGEQVAVTFDGAPAVVRAPRWALVRTMVMLVHAAVRAADPARSRGGAAVRVVGEEAEVRVHIGTGAAPSGDLVALAERCGGRVATTGNELTLSLPSLRAQCRG